MCVFKCTPYTSCVWIYVKVKQTEGKKTGAAIRPCCYTGFLEEEKKTVPVSVPRYALRTNRTANMWAELHWQ